MGNIKCYHKTIFYGLFYSNKDKEANKTKLLKIIKVFNLPVAR